MTRDPITFILSCTNFISALPPSERLPKVKWLSAKMKTGPVSRWMLSELQRECMLEFIRSRLIRGDDDA